MQASALLPRTALGSALSLAAKVVERRNTIPVLSNAAIFAHAGGVVVRATNGALDMQATINVPGAVSCESFAVTLPAHPLADLDKKAGATEHLAIDIERTAREPIGEDDDGTGPARPASVSASLDFEGLRVAMHALPIEDFPELRIDGEINADFTIPTRMLADILESVAFAISQEEVRYYLNGIYVHPHTDHRTGARFLRFVATDGHRLAETTIPAPDGIGGEWGVIIPRKSVDFLQRVAKAKNAPESTRILVNCTKIRVTIGDVDVISKLIDGTYPDYQRVIPACNDRRFTVDRKALEKAVKAVTAVASERGRAVKLTLTEAGATLAVHNPDMGTATMDVPGTFESDCGELEIGFNAKYVLDILDQIAGDTVALDLADPGSPTIITDATADGAEVATRFVLMPMRV